jgi:hypothetical protein
MRLGPDTFPSATRYRWQRNIWLRERFFSQIRNNKDRSMRALTYLKAAAAGLMLAGAASLGAQAAPVASQGDEGVFQFAQMKSGGEREFIRRRGGGGGDRMIQRQRMGDRNFNGRQRVGDFDGRRRFDGRRYDNRRWAWDRNRHGQRYRYRRPGYAYYRDGYWYGSPWWLGAATGAIIGSAIVGSAAASSDAHIDYCLSRYRTYDPQTDTYIGKGGRRYRCVGP